MGGGNRHVVLNLNERVVSPDHNRHQQIGARERCEHMRFQANVLPGLWEVGEPFGAPSVYGTVDSPLVADVFQGLTVLPQAGTLSLFVVPGVVGLLDPDGQAGSSDPAAPSADDSPYKIVRDPGIVALGALLIGAGGGGIRIDVVECRRKEVVTELATRDVFDPAAGAFTPTAGLDKVSEGELTYRVRAGVAGAGFPGTALGWLPLAVVSVPAVAASVDAMTFWDVRPLVSDRISPPSRMRRSFAPPLEQNELYADQYTAPPAIRIGGNFTAEIHGYRVGGRLRKGTPSAVMGAGDLNYVDANNVENQDPTFAPAGGDLWYFWLTCPYGLPRWVRYEETAAGQRLPWGMHGIPLVTSVGPAYNAMTPSTDIYLPASTGLDPAMASTIYDCVCAGTGCCVAGTPNGFVANGDWLFPTALPAFVAPASVSLNFDEYHLVEGRDFPGNARAVKVEVTAFLSGVAAPFGKACIVEVLHNATANFACECHREYLTHAVTAGNTSTFAFCFEVPRIPPVATPGLLTSINFRVYWNLVGGTKANEECRVLGWRVDG